MKPHFVLALIAVAVTLPRVVAQAFSTVALLLLTASGVSKTVDPDPTRGALRDAHLPSSAIAVRSLGVIEILAGLTGLTLGGAWLGAGLVLYVGFFGFTLAAKRERFALQSCGCFGRDDTPPTWLHVTYNGLAALSLGYLAAVNRSPVPGTDDLSTTVLVLGFGLIGAYLSYLLLSQLPITLSLAADR
jgi:Methylamine utilisation protein MauE